MNKARVAAIGLAVAGILVGMGMGSVPRAPVVGGVSPGATDQVAPAPAPPSTLVVYVSGWVATPGVVELDEGSIVADAVAAAGGAREGAVLGAINLAQTVVPGDHIDVPGPDASPAVIGASGDGMVHPNTASAGDLEILPGVGPVLAGRIVAYRDANGPFDTAEDMLDVPGIGESKLAAFRDLIVVP